MKEVGGIKLSYCRRRILQFEAKIIVFLLENAVNTLNVTIKDILL